MTPAGWRGAAVFLLAAGCYGPIGPHAHHPAAMAPVIPSPSQGCIDLSGTYLARPSRTERSSGFDLSGGWSPEGSQPRPLGLLFSAVEAPEPFERVDVTGPTARGRLSFRFEGTGVAPHEVSLEAGVDYDCEQGAVRLQGPKVARREGAAIQLDRGPAGALITQLKVDEPAIWFLFLPISAFKWWGEWSSYPPAGGGP